MDHFIILVFVRMKINLNKMTLMIDFIRKKSINEKMEKQEILKTTLY